ncbi:MAG: type II toxin-antitoxin system VapC family toxin [Gemmatimonadetes bacterium]|nr:type II toxin-antitoxin system VapC family toxin [Gemmatimonadota bacterium]
MNVIDSSGWLEYFADGSNADFFAPAIERPTSLLVPSISLLEVFKRVLQQRDESAALQAVALMQQGQVVDLDGAIALTAARLGTDFGLPLADSVILATARHFNATVWTQDADFDGLPDVRFTKKR